MTKRSGKKADMASASGAAKKARPPGKVTKLDATAAGQPEEEDTAMTFSMELRALECPVCLIPFDAEVYMCKNGHAACAGCCIRTDRKCGCCGNGEPIGDIRNRPLEKLLAAMMTPCKFARYGRGETVKYTDKRGHEECARAPCDCPFDGCGFRELGLYDHIRGEHQDSAVMMNNLDTGTTMTLEKGTPFLAIVEPDSRRVFVLRNGGDVLEGRSLSLLYLGPLTEREMKVKYTMEVSGEGPGLGTGASRCRRRAPRRAPADSRGSRRRGFSSCRMLTGDPMAPSPS